MQTFPEPFASLRWHRLKVALVNTRCVPGATGHPFAIIQAIVKGVCFKVDGAYDSDNPRVIFHIKDRSHRAGLRQSERLNVEVFFFRSGLDYAMRWAEGLREYLADPVTGKNFAVETIGEIEERTFETLSKEFGWINPKGAVGTAHPTIGTAVISAAKQSRARTKQDVIDCGACSERSEESSCVAEAADLLCPRPANANEIAASQKRSSQRQDVLFPQPINGIREDGELCLEFLTPFPFNAPDKKRRTVISKDAFAKSFEKRFTRLFGKEFAYDADGDSFALLPYYWNYTQIAHSSKSQPGQTQYVKGCVGRLYVKGRFKNLLPFLLLGSELHAGGKVGSSQGYYSLRFDAPGHFKGFFPRKTALLGAADHVLERYDSTLVPASEEDGFDFDDKAFVDKLLVELHSGAYSPSPSTAFTVAKKDGTTRLVERFRFKDLVVQSYLLRTITPVFERAFEDCSTGFRRGISRDDAAAMIDAAVKDGCQYALESDIEDFFPSVNHAELERLIGLYIPDDDCLIKDLLFKTVKAGYSINGTLHERLRGLAQGGPLSPLLTNLYLDSFDEKMLGEGARLVRYADDFVILCRTEEDAQRFLGLCEAHLAEVKLKLKKEKTAIRRIDDGFTFLGMTFNGEGAEEPEEILKRLKKPLYVLEPNVFLSLNGDAIDVIKDKAVSATFPLRMISEIMLMERAVISTALAGRCVRMNVPITLTLDTGYYVTTIKPDSKAFYDISASHGARYISLTDTERLSIAREFVEGKLLGYIPFFAQRDGRGPLVMELEASARRVHSVGTVEELRGIEGAAARRVYGGLNTLIDNEVFHIKKRERKSPDRINSLLNFGHYLLFSRINATVRGCGLNPYLGFLHSHADDYESFVCDIQELFRARIDRLIVRLVNLKIIRSDDFKETESGMRLKHDAVKRFIDKFEAEMEKKAEGDSLTLKDSIYLQAVVFKKWAVENGRLTFYKWRL